MTNNQRIFELDALRAFAITLVVLFHLNIAFFEFGYLGVDVFFVLSGYLMVHIVLNEKETTGTINVWRFITRRFLRIYPSLLITSVLTMLVALLLFSPSHTVDVAIQVQRTLLIVSNFLFYDQSNYFAPANEIRPLLHTWSLSVEEQFYLIFALMLLLSSKFGISYQILLLFIIGLLMLLATSGPYAELNSATLRLLNWPPVEKIEDATFYLLPFRLVQFSAGGLLAVLHRRKRQKAVSHITGSCIVALAIVMLVVASVMQTNSASQVVAIVSTLLLIHPNKLTAKIGSLTWVKFIAKISYQIYLMHWPVIVFWRHLTFEQPSPIEQVLLGVLSISTGWTLWNFTSMAFRSTTTDKIPSQRINQFLVSLTIAIVSLGSTVWVVKENGLIWRIPEQLRSLSTQQLRAMESEYCGTSHIKGERELGSQPGDSLITCTINPGGIDTIYAFGDSHARHLGPGLAKHFPNSKIAILYFTSCHVQSGLGSYTYDYEGRDALSLGCIDRNLRALKFFQKIKPATILVHQFAGYHSDQQDAFYDATHLLIKQLRSSGHRVLWVGPVVRPAKLLGECGAVPYTFPSGLRARRCTGEQETAQMIIDYSSNLKLRYPSTFIDASPFFCDNKFTPGSCRTFSQDGRALFRDKHHLSIAGSESLVGYLKDRISAASP